MKEKEVADWQRRNKFNSRQIAALIEGISPFNAEEKDIQGKLSSIQDAYNIAVWANLYLINPLGNIDYKDVPEIALQSNVMINLVDSENWGPKFNHHDLYSWLNEDSDSPGEWYRSTLEEQFFNGSEISRWLKAINISSVFPFDTSQITPLANVEVDKDEVSTVANENIKLAQPTMTYEPTHDPLPLDGIALIFIINTIKDDNIKEWRVLAKDARRNGLVVARIAMSTGSEQSKFDPVAVGDWLVNKGKIDRARVDRVLQNNYPPRNAGLKEILT